MKVSLSVDLDNYQHYRSLVETEPCPGSDLPSFFEQGVPGFLDLFEELGGRGTFFAIGNDLGRPEHGRLLRAAVERGHEVGNHSYSHPYNFRQLSRAEKQREIEQGEAAIADATGVRPVGFRTPSCDVDAETHEILRERGYLYDSSIFPTPVMWAFMIYGRIFVSNGAYQLGSPSQVFAPRRPYLPRPRALYRRRLPGNGSEAPLVEIPVSCVPWLRIPFYSTLQRLLGTRFFELCAALHKSEPLHMLLHQIELVDFEGTDLETSMKTTPGIGVPYARRARFVRHAASTLARLGPLVPMRELAEDALAICETRTESGR